jgi:hypothetical protein
MWNDYVHIEICALLGYNAASSGNPLPTFRDNVSVPSSRAKKSKKSRKPATETHPRLSLHKPRVSVAGFLLFLDFLTLEDGTDTLSRNVGKGLPLDAAWYPRRAQILSASQRKPEVTYMLFASCCSKVVRASTRPNLSGNVLLLEADKIHRLIKIQLC